MLESTESWSERLVRHAYRNPTGATHDVQSTVRHIRANQTAYLSIHVTAYRQDVRDAVSQLQGVMRYIDHRLTHDPGCVDREQVERRHIYRSCLSQETATLDDTLLRLLDQADSYLSDVAIIDFWGDDTTDFLTALGAAKTAAQLLALWHACADHLSDADQGSQALQNIKEEQRRLLTKTNVAEALSAGVEEPEEDSGAHGLQGEQRDFE